MESSKLLGEGESKSVHEQGLRMTRWPRDAWSRQFLGLSKRGDLLREWTSTFKTAVGVAVVVAYLYTLKALLGGVGAGGSGRIWVTILQSFRFNI